MAALRCHTLTPARMNALPVAGFWRRFAAVVYDTLIVMALLMVAAALATLVTELLAPGLNARNPDTLRHHPLYLSWLLLWWFAYYAWSWRKGGQTVGMKAWRLQLISRQGGPLQMWQICLRLGVGGFAAALLLAVYGLLNALGLKSVGMTSFLLLLALQMPALAMQERLSQTVTLVLPKLVKK